jgi:hypothetical protein
MTKTMKFMMALAMIVGLSSFGYNSYADNPGNPVGGQFAKKHPRRNQVNKRVRNQRARINQGLKNGTLTQQQAAQLRANDNAIKAQEHADVKANGGYLTKGEQKQLNQELNANSKLIYDEKHPAPPAQQ